LAVLAALPWAFSWDGVAIPETISAALVSAWVTVMGATQNRKVYLLLIVNLTLRGRRMIVEMSVGIITIGTAGYVLWQLRVRKSVSRSILRKVSRALKSEN